MRLWKKSLAGIIVALLLVCAVIVIYPVFLSMRTYPREPSLKSNMHTVQLAIEDFSGMAAGRFPADINTTVEEVAGISSDSSNGLFSISGAKGLDPVSEKDIGSTGATLLPKTFRNPYYQSQPALGTSLLDPPRWSPEVRGMVFYVPLDIEGKTAGGYKVYGAGPDSLLGLVLHSQDLQTKEPDRE
jgi:hypothetical protein